MEFQRGLINEATWSVCFLVRSKSNLFVVRKEWIIDALSLRGCFLLLERKQRIGGPTLPREGPRFDRGKTLCVGLTRTNESIDFRRLRIH